MNIKSLLLASSIFLASPLSFASGYSNGTDEVGKFAIADRASGTVSVIDANTDQLINTLTLPAANNPSEPMYIVYKENRLYIGDRANDRVVVYDSYGLNFIKSLPTGRGVFHMWAAKNAELLAVNNDIDNTVTLIDTNDLNVVDTLSLPSDLINRGFRPHDVFLSDNGKQAYISLLDGVEGDDYVIKYSLSRNREVARRSVGGDPHLFLSPTNKNRLLVASQDSGTVVALNTKHLRERDQVKVPNAHGIFALGERLYVSNIADNGSDGLYTLENRWLNVIQINDTPFPTPHNIAVSDNGEKIYITHSGAQQDKVSVFVTKPGLSFPSYEGEVTVGKNPFGLAYIPH